MLLSLSDTANDQFCHASASVSCFLSALSDYLCVLMVQIYMLSAFQFAYATNLHALCRGDNMYDWIDYADAQARAKGISLGKFYHKAMLLPANHAAYIKSGCADAAAAVDKHLACNLKQPHLH